MILKAKKLIYILILLCFTGISTYLINGYQINNSDFTSSLKHEVKITGVLKAVDENKAEVIFTKINNRSFINRFFIDLKNTKLVEIEKLDTIEITTNASNIETYFKKDLIVRLTNQDQVDIKTNLLASSIELITKKIDEVSQENFGENAKLVKAMVFGLKDDVSKEDSKIFRELGISHILVASGANILMIIGAISVFFDKIAFLGFKSKRFLELILVIFYLCLVGFEGSISRAFFFFIINLASRFIGRDIDYLEKILVSIVLLIFIFPSLVFGISFFLSLAATLSIKISSDVSEFFNIQNKFINNFLSNFFIVSIVNLLTSFFFRSINFSGLISNLIVLALVEIIVIYGFTFVSSFTILNILGVSLFISKLLALPLNYLISIFREIVNILYLGLGDRFNFRYSFDFKSLITSYILIITLWILVKYRIYKSCIGLNRTNNDPDMK